MSKKCKDVMYGAVDYHARLFFPVVACSLLTHNWES